MTFWTLVEQVYWALITGRVLHGVAEEVKNAAFKIYSWSSDAEESHALSKQELNEQYSLFFPSLKNAPFLFQLQERDTVSSLIGRESIWSLLKWSHYDVWDM